MTVEIVVFWIVTQYSFEAGYQCLGGLCDKSFELYNQFPSKMLTQTHGNVGIINTFLTLFPTYDDIFITALKFFFSCPPCELDWAEFVFSNLSL
jgi:hypothetical protein